jgi:hypothetical protein
MNVQAILGLCSVVLALISVIVIPLFVVFFRMGKSASTLERHGTDIETLRVKTDTHAGDLAGIGALRELVDEVRHDVKSLLTGRRGRGPAE